jgi:hypothetical protein
MKRSILALAALISAALGAAAQGRLELRLVPGPAYSHTKWFGPAPIKLLPQTAFWIETADGRFVDSIYVTHRSAAADWRFAAGARRPEALPLWSHSRGLRAADGLFMPDAGRPLPDAISGATPEAAFSKTWAPPAGLAPGSYRIRAELNLAYDWNEAYPDKLPTSDPRWSAANGQPSILWEAELVLGTATTSAELAPVGSGSLDGSDGALRSGLEGMTSARRIAASITATYKP